jgi:hypothetical protein
MYTRIAPRSIGYILVICSGLMALIAYLALPFVYVGGPPFVGTISFTGVQLLIPQNPNINPGGPTFFTSPYLPVHVAVLLLVLATILTSVLVFSDHAPKTSLTVWLGRGAFVVVSITSILLLLVVVWPPKASLSFLGGGFWLIALAGFLMGIGGIVTML